MESNPYHDKSEVLASIYSKFDILLDNQDVCLMLGGTKRTLARYRKLKLLKYHTGDRKVYYYYSDVMKFLKQKDESL